MKKNDVRSNVGQEKLSMLSIFVTLAKFGVVLFSWVATILFVLVVLMVTDKGSE